MIGKKCTLAYLMLSATIATADRAIICTENVLEENYPNQNTCQLLEEIPRQLRDLPYAIYPNNLSYNTLRFNYNKQFNLFPHAIICPRKTSEVAFVLKTLREHNLEFSIRCGGHCYEPGSLSSGYVIDLRNFNFIQPNLKKQEVYIGAGCLIGEVLQKLGAIDYAIPTGDCPVVGISGLSLGGGQGVLTRTYGLTCDSIKSLLFMTADGDLLEVDEKNYPELYWALRGAGNGSFGIVLGFTFKMYPIPKVRYLQLEWEWNKTLGKQIFEKWQEWLLSLPYSITSHLRLVYENEKSKMVISMVKVGDEPLEEWKKTFEALNPKIKSFVGTYLESVTHWAEAHSDPFSKSKSSMIFEPMSLQGIDLIADLLTKMEKEKPPYRLHFTFASLGGEAMKGSSAFFPRAATIMWHQMVTWATPDHEKPALKTLNEFYTSIAPHLSPYCYANVVDYDLNDQFLNAYYGDHVKRLIAIKKRWDPLNVFHWKQSIPLENPLSTFK